MKAKLPTRRIPFGWCDLEDEPSQKRKYPLRGHTDNGDSAFRGVGRKLYRTIAALTILLASGIWCPEISSSDMAPVVRWKNYLEIQCWKHDLPFRKMERVAWAESRWNPQTTEYRNGRAISWGVYQVGRGAARMFLDAKGYTVGDEVGWIKITENNIDVTLWLFKNNLQLFRGDFRKAVMAHALGPNGAIEYLKQNGGKLYFPYHRQDAAEKIKREIWY